jgi:dolichyl-phosphate beta-glucosyltransferase
VLVVGDGGQDGTEIEVRRVAGERENISFLENGVNRGKGFSVRRGVLEAAGQVILFTDADGSTPIHEFDKLRAALDDGYDMAIGSRALAGSDIRLPQSRARRNMGRAFNCFVQRVAVSGIRDTQCGFKCFTREAARRIFPRLRIDRFGFDVEILWLARKLGYRVAELPVTWNDRPNSTVHPIRDASRMLFDVMTIRLRDASGYYGGAGSDGSTRAAAVPPAARRVAVPATGHAPGRRRGSPS